MVNSPYNTSATSRRSSRRSSSPPSDRTLSFFKNTSDNDDSYTSDTRSGRFPLFSRTDSSRSVSRDRSDSRSRSRSRYGSRSGSKSRSVSRSRSTSRSRAPRKAYSDKKLYVRGYGSRSRSRSASRPRRARSLSNTRSNSRSRSRSRSNSRRSNKKNVSLASLSMSSDGSLVPSIREPFQCYEDPPSDIWGSEGSPGLRSRSSSARPNRKNCIFGSAPYMFGSPQSTPQLMNAPTPKQKATPHPRAKSGNRGLDLRKQAILNNARQQLPSDSLNDTLQVVQDNAMMEENPDDSISIAPDYKMPPKARRKLTFSDPDETNFTGVSIFEENKLVKAHQASSVIKKPMRLRSTRSINLNQEQGTVTVESYIVILSSTLPEKDVPKEIRDVHQIGRTDTVESNHPNSPEFELKVYFGKRSILIKKVTTFHKTRGEMESSSQKIYKNLGEARLAPEHSVDNIHKKFMHIVLKSQKVASDEKFEHREAMIIQFNDHDHINRRNLSLSDNLDLSQNGRFASDGERVVLLDDNTILLDQQLAMDTTAATDLYIWAEKIPLHCETYNTYCMTKMEGNEMKALTTGRITNEHVYDQGSPSNSSRGTVDASFNFSGSFNGSGGSEAFSEASEYSVSSNPHQRRSAVVEDEFCFSPSESYVRFEDDSVFEPIKDDHFGPQGWKDSPASYNSANVSNWTSTPKSRSSSRSRSSFRKGSLKKSRSGSAKSSKSRKSSKSSKSRKSSLVCDGWESSPGSVKSARSTDKSLSRGGCDSGRKFRDTFRPRSTSTPRIKYEDDSANSNLIFSTSHNKSANITLDFEVDLTHETIEPHVVIKPLRMFVKVAENIWQINCNLAFSTIEEKLELLPFRVEFDGQVLYENSSDFDLNTPLPQTPNHLPKLDLSELLDETQLSCTSRNSGRG